MTVVIKILSVGVNGRDSSVINWNFCCEVLGTLKVKEIRDHVSDCSCMSCA